MCHCKKNFTDASKPTPFGAKEKALSCLAPPSLVSLSPSPSSSASRQVLSLTQHSYLQSLAECTLCSFASNKLLMQSNLDSTSSSFSNHLHDLDLLLRYVKEDLGLFIRGLFTKLQIGGVEYKKKALESLLQLLNNDEKSAGLVAKEGNVGHLVSLLDVNNNPLIHLGASLVAQNSDEGWRGEGLGWARRQGSFWATWLGRGEAQGWKTGAGKVWGGAERSRSGRRVRTSEARGKRQEARGKRRGKWQNWSWEMGFSF